MEKAQTGAWQREREGTCEGPTRLTTGGRAGRVGCPGRRLALTCSGLITDTQVNATLPKMPEISSKIWLSSHSHVHLLSKPSIKIENRAHTDGVLRTQKLCREAARSFEFKAVSSF